MVCPAARSQEDHFQNLLEAKLLLPADRSLCSISYVIIHSFLYLSAMSATARSQEDQVQDLVMCLLEAKLLLPADRKFKPHFFLNIY
jgi:hypothetical protein